MSEEKKTLSLIPHSIDNALTNLTDSPTTLIGKIIHDALYVKFEPLILASSKLQIQNHYDLKAFEKKIQEQIAQIPPEKLVIPPAQTLNLAVDDAIPCLETATIKELFSNLITRSCNIDYSAFIHPSFSSVLKQMSPLDVKILNFFIETSQKKIITYTYYNDDRYNGFNRIPYTFENHPEQQFADHISVSISSLLRLGILSFYDDALVHEIKASPFLESDFYKQCEHQRISEGKYRFSCVTGRLCELTPFGSSFMNACIA